MKVDEKHNLKMAKINFAKVYPCYLNKIKKKGRTEAELMEIIKWLTGFDKSQIQDYIDREVNFEMFFNEANLNPKASLITGVICGYRIEEIEFTLTKQVRYLDKLVDELAKGHAMNKILRE